MNTPSVKTLVNRLGLETHQAKRVKASMDNLNHSVDRTMRIANDELGGHGIESIRDDEWDNYYCDIGLLYVNMGDAYTDTLVYDTRSGRFRVTSWGDIVERNERRFADR